jgi:hypothetical protein
MTDIKIDNKKNYTYLYCKIIDYHLKNSKQMKLKFFNNFIDKEINNIRIHKTKIYI